MKNILKFGLLTRFVMLFLFIFGIHTFTPTVALAAGDGMAYIDYQAGNCPNTVVWKSGSSSVPFEEGETVTFQDATCEGHTLIGYEYTENFEDNEACMLYGETKTAKPGDTLPDSDYYTLSECRITAVAQWSGPIITFDVANPFSKTNRQDILDCIYNNNCDTWDLENITVTTADCPSRSSTYSGGIPSENQLYYAPGYPIIDTLGTFATCDFYYSLAENNPSSSKVRIVGLGGDPTHMGFDISLNKNGGTSGSSTLYTRYYTGVYTDANLSKSMSTSANAITKPTRGYTVTYNANGGSVSSSSASANRTFNGYYSAATGGTQYINANGYITTNGLSVAKDLLSNTTWYAQWGSAGTVTLPTPTRAGHTFKGWYTSATNGTRVGGAGANYTVSNNITLYAQWTIQTYTITLNDNGGRGGQGSVTVKYGEYPETLTKLPTRNGYKFMGYAASYNEDQEEWKGQLYDKNGAAMYKYTTSGNTTLIAMWEAAPYTVTLHADGCDGFSKTIQINQGEMISNVIADPTTCACGAFRGWYDTTEPDENSYDYRTGPWGSYAAPTDLYALTIDSSIGCGTGFYLPAATSSGIGGEGCKQCPAGSFCPGVEPNVCSLTGPVGKTTCENGYTSEAGSYKASQCYIDVPSGKYLDTAKSSTLKDCPAGSKCPATRVYYGNTVLPQQCGAGYYSAKNAGSCSPCGKGNFCSSGATAPQVCPGNTYSESSTASSCNSCSIGYTISGTTAANHDSKSDCKITCSAGTYVKTAGGSCVNASVGYYIAGQTVSEGTTQTPTQCPKDPETSIQGTTAKEGTSAAASCYITKPCSTSGVTGTGKQSCNYNTGTGKYDSRCTACAIDNCPLGYELVSGSCAPKTFTITLVDARTGGNNIIIKQVYKTKWTNSTNETITVAPIQTRSGYNFDGYYDAASGGNKIIGADGTLPSNTKYTADATLFVRWIPKTYVIKYVSYESGKLGEQTCTVGQSCIVGDAVKSAITQTGSTFGGIWTNDEISCGRGEFNQGDDLINYPTCAEKFADENNNQFPVLKAHFTPNTYYIKYNANGGNGSVPSNTKCTYGVKCDLVANPFNKTGFSFLGWSKKSNPTANDVDFANNGYVPANASLTATNGATVTLYAVWGTCTACNISSEGAYCSLDTSSGSCVYKSGCNAGYSKQATSTDYKPVCSANKLRIPVYQLKQDMEENATPLTYVETYYNKPLPKLDLSKITRRGYTFVEMLGASYNQSDDDYQLVGGIFYDANGNPTGVPIRYTNLKLYATWTANSYMVELDPVKASKHGTPFLYYSFEQDDPCKYYLDSTLERCAENNKIESPARVAYSFRGYHTENDGTGDEYVDDEGTISDELYTTVADNSILYADWDAVCTPVMVYVAEGDSGYRVEYIYMYPDSTTVYSDSDCKSKLTKMPDAFKGYTEYSTFDGWWANNADGELVQCVDKNMNFTGNCTLVTEEDSWDQRLVCNPGYWCTADDDEDCVTGDPCTPLCYPINFNWEEGNGNEWDDTLYMKHGDGSQLYKDEWCATPIPGMQHQGYIDNATNAIGFFKRDEEGNSIQCTKANGILIPNACVETDADNYWYLRYQCDNGYYAPGTDNGEGTIYESGDGGQCQPMCYPINFNWEEGNGSEVDDTLYMKHGDGSQLYEDKWCSTPIPGMQHRGHIDNATNVIGFFKRDENNNSIQCTDKYGILIPNACVETDADNYWYLRYQCDNGYYAPDTSAEDNTIYESGDGGQCQPMCYEIELSPMANDDRYDMLWAKYGSVTDDNLYNDDACDSHIQGAYAPDDKPNATWLGYVTEDVFNRIKPMTPELSDDIFCTDSQGSATGNCDIASNTKWVAVYKCNDDYTAAGTFVDYNTSCAATAMTVNYICEHKQGGVEYTDKCDYDVEKCYIKDYCSQVGYDTTYTVDWGNGSQAGMTTGTNIFELIDGDPTEVTVTAYRTTIGYKLLLVDTDGTVLQTKSCAYEKDCEIPSLTKDGYTLVNYLCSGKASCNGGTADPDKDFNTEYIDETSTNGMTVTLTAQWVPNTYTITLNKNGGNANGAPGQIYEKPNDGWYGDDLTQKIGSIGRLPIKDQYVFNGFFTEQNGTGTQVITSDGRIVAPNFLFDSDDEVYAYYTNCKCKRGDGVSKCSIMGTASENTCLFNVTCESDYSDSGNDTDSGGQVAYVAYGKPGVAEYTATCKKIGVTTGYTCPADSTKYIRCVEGNYMATMDTSGNYVYNGEPTSGNSCENCPSDAAYCPGGTSAPLYKVTLDAEGLQSEYSKLLANVNAEYYKDLVQDEETGNVTATRLEGTLPAEFIPTAHDGKTFNGYWTQSQGGEQYIGASGNFIKGPSADVTLYAQWSQDQYIISYACDYGDGTAPSQTTCDAGTECLLANSTCATPAGHMFFGWRIDNKTIDNFTDINTVLSAGTYTATAQYEEIEPEFKMVVYPKNSILNTQTFKLSGVQGTFLFDCGNGESFAFFASADTSSITPACKYSTYNQEYEIKIASVDDPIVKGAVPQTFVTRVGSITNTNKNNSMITKLDGSLGKLFNNNNLSAGFASTFANATKLTDISPTLLDGFSKLVSVNGMFSGSTSLTNISLNLLTPKEGCMTYVSSGAAYGMFMGSTQLSSVTDWDDNVTSYLPASLYERLNSCEIVDVFKQAFDGTALADTCPAGMYEVGKIGGKPACAPCPSNSSSEAGATECTCNDGFNYNGGTTTTTEACVANVPDTVYTIEYYCSIDDFSGDVKMSTQCYAGQDGCENFVDPGCENDDYTYSYLYYETGTVVAGTARTDNNSLLEALAAMSNQTYNPSGITTIKVRPKWVASVTLNNQGADLGNGTEGFYIIDGKVYANIEGTQTLSQIALPKKTGNSFIGYYDETNCVGHQVVNNNGVIDTAYFADKKGNMELHACWNPDWREIWYVVNDHQTATFVLYGTEITIGKGLPSQEDTEEKEVEIGERPGYTFTGWITEEGTEYKNGDKYTVEHSNILFLYATWSPNKYTVVFDANGGTGTMEEQDRTYDDGVRLPENAFTRDGYTFRGWGINADMPSGFNYANKSPNNIVRTGNIPVENGGTITLYALWTPIEYEISYNLNGGELVGEYPETYTIVTPTFDLPTPVKEGHVFGGWYSPAPISQIVKGSTGNIEITATWTPIEYDISYNLNGGELVGEYPETYTIVTPTFDLPTPVKEGHVFGGWYSPAPISQIVEGSTGNIEITASWTPIEYDITFDANDGTGSMATQTFTYGVAQNLTANAFTRDGYAFTGWNTASDGSGTAYADKASVKNLATGGTITLYAQWSQNVMNVYYEYSNASVTCVGNEPCYLGCSRDGSDWDCGTPFETRNGYNAIGFVVSDDIDYKLNGEYAYGTDMTGWANAYNGSTFTLNANAYWEPITYDITYNTNGGELVGEYPKTYTIVTPTFYLPTPVQDGYDFVGWFNKAGEQVTEIATGSTGNIELTAQWKAMTFTCKSGEYLDVKACKQCPKGYKCPQTQFTYDKNVQGLIACSGATEYQDQPGQATCKTVSDGYYKKDNTAQTECGNGYYCKDAVRTVCPDNGLTSTTTATDVTDCYKNNQSCTVDGGVGISDVCHYDTTKSGYKNCTVCIINGCNSGYYKDGDACTICPKGSYCANSDINACPDKYTTAGTGATKQSDCFTTCDDMSVEYGIAHADNATVYAPARCTYSRGTSATGNPCDIIDDVCVETSCKFDYEMKGGKCTECVRDNARTFKQGNGNCVVESCEFGYHPFGQSCVPVTKECTTLPMHAIAAQQTWDTKTNSYTVCQITECADGYHISNNTCISDEQTCNVANGIGVQTWNHSLNKWDGCVATKCNPGYTNDHDLMWPAHAKDISIQCGRCDNAFDINGAEAVSAYVRECEIATCMYQGKKYILENNECRLICNEFEDETGSRYWDSKSEKCVHTCNAGYQEW